jgi:serine/threonine protein kinase
MALSAGITLGPYEVLSPIGAGGMGEVYKARDTRLDRTIAIKVLPDHIAKRDELRARFEREARAVASLNHPNICTLHDIGNQDGTGYMVMEYLEGETLAERIKRGALPIAQARRFATQIADALDRAHRAGVVHRDVKPQNIMLTRDGVKVLDFGLAKSMSDSGSAEETVTAALTREGTVLGTPHYMAPEQFEGKPVDARSDIWSFGAVVYEMITGRRPFEGKSYTSLVGTILTADVPPMSATPTAPTWLEQLVRRCLEKDPEDRYFSMHDVLLDLRTPIEARTVASQNTSRWPFALAALTTLVALAVSAVHFGGGNERPRLLKLTVLPPENANFHDQYSIPAVSPDGLRIAFMATSGGKEQLWVRELDSVDARVLPGTEGAAYPFWSPNSQTLAFFSDGKLKKIEATGGPAVTLCDAFPARGGTWGTKDVIVWGGFGTGLFRVSASGGRSTAVTEPRKKTGAGDHRFPSFLPDGRHFLYTDTALNQEESGIYVADLESKDRKRIVTAHSRAVYSPPGYLLFVHEGTLMAQPFDAGKLQTMGDPVPISDQIDSQSSRAQYQFTVSNNGVLVYTAGRHGGGALLTWFDRSGKSIGTLGGPNAQSWGAISPDGTTVAVQRIDRGFRDIWLHDLARGTASRLTVGPGSNGYPAWSPDGSRVSFFSARNGIGQPFQRNVRGAREDEVLTDPVGEPPTPTSAEDWSRDGRYLILRSVHPTKQFDIWVLPLNPDKPDERKAFLYLQTEFAEVWAKLSPDGRWLAYTSDETKRNEIYVQSFPTPGNKLQVSTNGGERAVWSRDGKELYFISADGRMMAVEVKSGARFEIGLPKGLFSVRLARDTDSWFDVTKDGRFLIPVQVDQTAKTNMTVVLNWQTALKK